MMMVRLGLDLEPPPVAIASKVLADRLEALAPQSITMTPVELVGPDEVPLDYRALAPSLAIAARDVRDAKPGHLQWGALAFSPDDAPAPAFALWLGSQALLIVAAEIAEALDVGTLGEVQTSAFHRTPEAGGARAEVAALQRMLEGDLDEGS